LHADGRMDGRTIGQTQRKNMRLLVKVTEKFKNIYPLGKFVLASIPCVKSSLFIGLPILRSYFL